MNYNVPEKEVLVDPEKVLIDPKKALIDLKKISIHNAIDKLNANQAPKKKQIFCLRKWDLIRFLEEKRLWKISICKTKMKWSKKRRQTDHYTV